MKGNDTMKIDRNKVYMTVCGKPHSEHHRAKYIIHEDWQYYLAEFADRFQLDYFMKYLGFDVHFEYEEKAWWDENLTLEYYTLTHDFKKGIVKRGNFDSEYFWSLTELPEDVMPVPLVCNGAIVTGYFTNDGKTITVYRPNPNAKEVYKPLSLEKHLEFVKKFGSF